MPQSGYCHRPTRTEVEDKDVHCIPRQNKKQGERTLSLALAISPNHLVTSPLRMTIHTELSNVDHVNVKHQHQLRPAPTACPQQPLNMVSIETVKKIELNATQKLPTAKPLH